MIKFDNVSYRYNQNSPLVIKNISIEIKEGESLAVMGLNGSGKSTFALLTAGLIEPSRGIIRINSENPNPFGFIFQNPDNQMVAMTVEKEVAFGLENQGMPFETMRADVSAVLDEFQITHFRNRITSELSGGEKQRVALASVMITKPDILILDEPDSFLDTPGKLILEQELQRIKNERPKMIQIHITQYTQTASKYDRMIIFKDGEVVVDENPREIFASDHLCRQAGFMINKSSLKFENFLQEKEKSETLHFVECKDVTFSYTDNTPIINNLSCKFKTDQVTGLVGYSGSGKSTLGAILTKLLPIESGNVVYIDNSNNIIDTISLQGKVSGIFQQPERQFFLNSCSEEILFGPKNIGVSLNNDSIREMFEFVGLTYCKFSQRDPFTLSGGEKRRLAFAVVLAMNPDFVIFDEPTCGLDWQGVELFANLAEKLKKAGKGLIIISHDGEIIQRLCDKILYLKDQDNHIFYDKSDFFSDNCLSTVLSIPLK